MCKYFLQSHHILRAFSYVFKFHVHKHLSSIYNLLKFPLLKFFIEQENPDVTIMWFTLEYLQTRTMVMQCCSDSTHLVVRLFEGILIGVVSLYIDLGQIVGYVQGFFQGVLGGASSAEICQGQSLMKTVRTIKNIVARLYLRHLLKRIEGESESRVDHSFFRTNVHRQRIVVSG